MRGDSVRSAGSGGWRQRLLGVSAAALLVPMLAAAAPLSGAGPKLPPGPRAPRQVPVAVHAVVAHPARIARMRRWHRPAVVWPAAGSAVAAVPAARTAGGTGPRVRPDHANAVLASPAAGAVRAGALPVRLSQATPGGPAAGVRIRVTMGSRRAAVAAGVSGVIFSLAQAAAARPAAELHVSLDYSGFAAADDGDFASRLHLVELPACALSTPRLAACRVQTPLPTGNDVTTGELGADVRVPAAAAGQPATGAPLVVLAAMTSTSGSGGDYSATPLSEAGSWQEGGSSGAFTYSYPISVPPVPGGLVPQVALDYDSQAVDGLSSATNNQASWVGDGWDYEPGYVERDYEPCSQDSSVPSADQKGDFCWDAGADVTTLDLGGAVTTLVDDPTNGWHAESDNGAEITYESSGTTNGTKPGDYWIVTEPDGTSYYFGLNELPGYSPGNTATDSTLVVPVYNPTSGDGDSCYSATFASSVCNLAWRWNLDYVTDAHGDAMAYFYYPQETNYYAPLGGTTSTAEYDRGGALKQIVYGFRNSSNVYGSDSAPAGAAEVNFAASADRTDIPTSSSTGDLQCTSGETSCDVDSPSFWTKYQLTGITTDAMDSGTMTQAGSWALTQDYFQTGDSANPSPLWLEKITEAGLPPVQFFGEALPNRAVNPQNNDDGYSIIDRDRLDQIITETGANITVAYLDPSGGCTSGDLPAPDANTLDCYPVYWAGQSSGPSWFNKYVVQDVSQADTTGNSPPVVTSYAYAGAAWHYDDDALSRSSTRTWDDWRGFATVTTNTGTSPDPVTQTVDSYFQGMNGDYQGAGNPVTSASLTSSAASGGVTVTDSDQYAGMLFEAITDDGSAVVSDAVTTPWSLQTADEAQPDGLPGLKAFLTGTQETQTFTALASGGYRQSDVTYQYDSYGRVVAEADAPDASSSDGPGGGAAEDTCTQTSYPDVGSAYLLDLPAEVITTAVPPTDCPVPTPPTQAELVSDVRYYYDGATSLSTAPSAGNLTQTQKATSYSGATEQFTIESESAYDGYGRVTSMKDADSVAGDDGTSDPATVTAYTPATGAEPTSVKVTDPAGLVTTTTYDPLWELPLTVTNPAGGVTTEAYDSLGRLTSVWTPGHAATGQAEYTFAYTVSDSGPSLITTDTLEPDGSDQTSETIFDSLGRTRETQTETASGDRDVTDTLYNSDGWPELESAAYWTSGAPSATLVAAPSDEVPDQTGYVYDDDGRVVKTITYSDAAEQYETDTAYGGNYTTTSYVSDTVPAGGTAQTSYTNGLGQLTYRYQYHSADPASTAGLDSGDQTSPVAWDQTAYTYWPAGQLHTVTDAAGNQWTDTYDLSGDETSSADPDRGAASATYDPDGNELSVTTGTGSVSFSYDADGRKIAEWSGATPGTPGAAGQPGTPAASQLAMWEYDSIKPGLPTESVSYVGGSGSGGQAYTEAVMGYNGYDLPTGTETVIPSGSPLAGTYFTEDSYTSSGQLSSYTDGAAGGLPAETVDYSYDTDGQPTSMAGTWAYVDSLSYTELGQPDEYQLGSSAEPAYLVDSYDSLGQLTGAVTSTGTSPVTADDQSYSYDSAGDVLSEDDAPATGKPQDQCFTYDGLGQLTQAWSQGTASCGTASTTAEAGAAAPYWEQYSYNGENDLTGETSTPPSGTATTYANSFAAAGSSQPHAPASQSVAVGSGSPAVTGYSYNAAGDLASIDPPSGPGSDLTWNDAGQLTAITPVGSSTPTASYVYDAAGDLLLQTDGATTTLYLPDEQITSNGGTLSGIRYYSIGGVTIAARASSGDVQYLVGNQQGTDDLAIDSATLDATWRFFDPDGNPVGTPPASWPGDRGFVGGSTDTATGLTNLGAREYNPMTSTFISPDAILSPGDPDDLNPYAYAEDNPSTDEDPSGLECAPGASSNANCNDGPVQNPPGGSSGGSGGGPTGGGPTGGPPGTHCTAMSCTPAAAAGPQVTVVQQFIASIFNGDPNSAQQTRALMQAYRQAMASADNDPKLQWSMLLGVCRQFGCSAGVTAVVQTEAFHGRVNDIWSHWRGMLEVAAFGGCALTLDFACAVAGIITFAAINEDMADHDYWGAAGNALSLGLGPVIGTTYHSGLANWAYNAASSVWGLIPDPSSPPAPFCPASECGAGTPMQRHLELEEEDHVGGPMVWGENGLSLPYSYAPGTP